MTKTTAGAGAAHVRRASMRAREVVGRMPYVWGISWRYGTFVFDIDGARAARQIGVLYYAAHTSLHAGVSAFLVARGRLLTKGGDRYAEIAEYLGEDDGRVGRLRALVMANPIEFAEVESYALECLDFVRRDLGITSTVVERGGELTLDAETFAAMQPWLKSYGYGHPMKESITVHRRLAGSGVW